MMKREHSPEGQEQSEFERCKQVLRDDLLNGKKGTDCEIEMILDCLLDIHIAGLKEKIDLVDLKQEMKRLFFDVSESFESSDPDTAKDFRDRGENFESVFGESQPVYRGKFQRNLFLLEPMKGEGDMPEIKLQESQQKLG